jgi:hypothetical protein
MGWALLVLGVVLVVLALSLMREGDGPPLADPAPAQPLDEPMEEAPLPGATVWESLTTISGLLALHLMPDRFT